MDAYVAALEAKLAEVSGIEVDQIKKNQFANAQSEQSAINEMTAYINNISGLYLGLPLSQLAQLGFTAIHGFFSSIKGPSTSRSQKSIDRFCSPKRKG